MTSAISRANIRGLTQMGEKLAAEMRIEAVAFDLGADFHDRRIEKLDLFTVVREQRGLRVFDAGPRLRRKALDRPHVVRLRRLDLLQGPVAQERIARAGRVDERLAAAAVAEDLESDHGDQEESRRRGHGNPSKTPGGTRPRARVGPRSARVPRLLRFERDLSYP